MKWLIAGLVFAALPVAAQELRPWAEGTPELKTLPELPSGLHSEDQLQLLRDPGKALFKAGFTDQDGAGRPMATQAIIPTKPRRPLTTAFARTSGPDP